MEDLLYVVETAIDYAFTKDRYVLNMYEYAKSSKMTKHQVTQFIQSSVALEISNLVEDLDEYLKGGADNVHKQLREAYGHIPKPRARKIRNYLYGILEDAWRYERDKKPGRKKKS
jgi:hypothetical protein